MCIRVTMIASLPSPDGLTPEMRALVERPETVLALNTANMIFGGERGKPYWLLARAYLVLRDAGTLPEEEAHARHAFCLLQAAEGGHDAIYKSMKARFEEIRERHGLGDDEDWPRGEGPEEHERLSAEYDALVHEHSAKVLRENAGEHLAHLFENEPEVFHALYERGRRLIT
jgi:hypothetical protein